MKLEITKDKVLEAASNCEAAKETLKTLFPECFEKQREETTGKKTDDAPDNQTIIMDGKVYYTIHGRPERYTIVKSIHPKASSGTWKTFTGNISGKLSAQSWVICNTKRFTLEDIYLACKGETKRDGSEGMEIIVSRLNNLNNPDLSIDHYDETGGKSI
jgi:hypothetical protein